ncbi:MAG: hypothetical protein V4692_04685, partial [Bdellovibrionota bacterium]
KVSGGKYEFSKDGKTYQANHEFMPNSNLKRSTIEVYSSEKQLLQIVVLLETPAGEIEMSVDGVLRARVQDINSLPLVSAFDAKGQLVETKVLFNGEPMTSLAQAN